LNGQIRKEGKRDRLYGWRIREGREESWKKFGWIWNG
jgi:hypothetical protein